MNSKRKKLIENEEKSLKNRNEKTKKNKKIKLVLIVIVLIIVVVLGIFVHQVWSKLNKINYSGLDENDLDVNAELYNEISDEITKSEFDQVRNIVFFGSDSTDPTDTSAGRSDSIMIASINPKYKSLKLISIPRDTYVTIPGFGKDKINHAYAYGGEQLSIKTINSNFSLDITEYVTIDFSGLINIINEVGGIELEITKAEMDVINNNYLGASYQLTGKKFVPMTKYGKVILNGEEALAHSRNRYVGSDFTRANRQRDVLTALLNKISAMPATKIYSLVDVFLAQVKTNINVIEYTGLLTSVITSKNEYISNITSIQIPSAASGQDQTINGTYYFVPDLSESKNAFVTYLYKK